MEKLFELPINRRKSIYGAINYRLKLFRRAILFVHDLNGHMNEHLFFNAVPYFCNRGYAVIRINLYGHQQKARRLDDCTLKQHGKDINLVLTHIQQQGYRKIALIGHGLGATAVLQADTSLANALVLWDPTLNTSAFVEEEAEIIDEETEDYQLDWGVKHYWGNRMPTELINIEDCSELLAANQTPISIISAGNSQFAEDVPDFLEYLEAPHTWLTIAGANHYFDQEGTERQLFLATQRWLRRWIS